MMKNVVRTLVVATAVSFGAATMAQAQVKDAWITAKTKIDLMTTEGIRTGDLNVDTVNGVVTLHGHVPTAQQRDRAAEIAKGIDGVKSVKNELQVVAEANKDVVEASDAQIKDGVEKAFKANRIVEDSDIRVASVNRGVVLLAGDADTINEQLQAVQTAHSVPGVKRVASEIKVKSMD